MLGKIRFNLRFILVAVVPYFVLLGLMLGALKAPLDSDGARWWRYVVALVMATYLITIVYWVTVLIAWVFYDGVRKRLGERTDADRDG